MPVMDILADPLSVLQKYLQIDTTNSKNDREVCIFWSSIFSYYHIKNHILPSGDYHNFETFNVRGAPERILLQNHLDVVPAHNENWDYDPFGGHFEGDYIYGRGALDMKSIAVAQAYAFIKLFNENHPQKDFIKFCSLVQEETTSEHGAIYYVKYLDQQGYKNLIVLGEGGFGLNVPEIFQGTLLLYEAEQKGMLWLSITIHSKGGHGSVSGRMTRLNPVLRAAKVAQKLSSYRFPIKVEDSVATFIEHLFNHSRSYLIRFITKFPGFKDFLFKTKLGTALTYRLVTQLTGIPDLFRTSLSVTNIHTNKIPGIEEKTELGRFLLSRIFRRSSKRKINPITRLGVNIIPSYATITCDIRFNSIYNVESVLRTIKKIIPKDADLQVLDSHEFSWSNCSIIHKSLQFVLEKNQTQDIILSPFLFIANSDNYFFRLKGHHSFGLAPIVISSLEELQRIHGDNERININDFREGCELYYQILKALVEELK